MSATEALPSKEEVKEEVKAATAATASSLRSLAAGGVGGVCAVVVGHPFDLVKVRLQTAEKGVYNGAIDVVRRTVAREGLARVMRAASSMSTARKANRSRVGSLCRCIGASRRRDAHV